MANLFAPHRGQTAEAALHRSFEQSVRQLAQLTQRLMAWQQEAQDNDRFPKPDLAELSGATNEAFDDPPDAVQAELQTRTVAATAAVLTEAYGEGGQYQAEGYTVQSSVVESGTVNYRVSAAQSQRVVFAFERDERGVLSVQDNQLSEAQTQDFLTVAQRITTEGFEPLEADTTGQVRAERLGALAPAGGTAQPRRQRRSPKIANRSDPQASVTALDLVQWRYASVVLGRDPRQVQHITQLAQGAGAAAGQSFVKLYRQDREAPLPLQPDPGDLPQMQRDIQQLKDLVWQVGPRRVEQLYQTQRQLSSPIPINSNEQVVESQQER